MQGVLKYEEGTHIYVNFPTVTFPSTSCQREVVSPSQNETAHPLTWVGICTSHWLVWGACVRVVDMVINRRLDFASLGLSSTKAICIHRMVNVINTNLYYSPYLFTLIRTPKQHFLAQGWLKTREFLMTTWNTNGNWLTDYYFLDIIFRLKSWTKI